MALLIGVLDYHLNTDIIILVDYKEKTITWIPRDVYSIRIMHRVNVAYQKGGLNLFKLCIEDLGFSKINDCICISMNSSRKVLDQIKVYVPINEYAEYYYPTIWGQPLERDKKTISFTPPGEMLAGERIHQFIGARTRVNHEKYKYFPDLERIKRQQVFIQSLIRDKFPFDIFLNYSVDIQAKQLKRFSTILKMPYKYCIFNPRLKPERINNLSILKPRHEQLKARIYYDLCFYFQKLFFKIKKLASEKFHTP